MRWDSLYVEGICKIGLISDGKRRKGKEYNYFDDKPIITSNIPKEGEEFISYETLKVGQFITGIIHHIDQKTIYLTINISVSDSSSIFNKNKIIKKFTHVFENEDDNYLILKSNHESFAILNHQGLIDDKEIMIFKIVIKSFFIFYM